MLFKYLTPTGAQQSTGRTVGTFDGPKQSLYYA